MDAACEHIDERLTPFYPQFVREVTKDDILRLMEIKMKRILKFSKDQADELIAKIEGEIAEIERELNRIVDVTCEWYEHLKNKYGAEHPRLTEIRNFDTIEATKVVEANQKLYIDRQEGFIGTGLKKAEFVCNCSDIATADIRQSELPTRLMWARTSSTFRYGRRVISAPSTTAYIATANRDAILLSASASIPALVTVSTILPKALQAQR